MMFTAFSVRPVLTLEYMPLRECMNLHEKRADAAFPSPHGFSTKRAIDESVEALHRDGKTVSNL